EIEPVVVRPPLVYGPGAKGNMAKLSRLALSPFPLPFRSVDNRRSLVSIANLASAIEFLATRPHPTQGTFHVTDPTPVSLSQIVSNIREGAGMPVRLFSMPVGLMRHSLHLAGLPQLAEQLF